MNQPSKHGLVEQIWRRMFFFVSAMMAALALVDFDAGRYAHGIGDLGVAILTLSLTVQFPVVRAIVQASGGSSGSAADSLKRREQLLEQAAKLRAENPWADHASRAGWVLLAVSLLLRMVGA